MFSDRRNRLIDSVEARGRVPTTALASRVTARARRTISTITRIPKLSDGRLVEGPRNERGAAPPAFRGAVADSIAAPCLNRNRKGKGPRSTFGGGERPRRADAREQPFFDQPADNVPGGDVDLLDKLGRDVRRTHAEVA